MRDIKIKKVLNGFQVGIGCQELVFEKKKKLLAELSRYIDNPKAVEKEYLKKYNLKDETLAYVTMGEPVYGTGNVVVGRCIAEPIETTNGVNIERSNE